MRNLFVVLFIFSFQFILAADSKGLLILGNDTTEIIIRIKDYSYRAGNLITGGSKIHQGIPYYNNDGEKDFIRPHQADKVILFLKKDTIVFVSRGVGDSVFEKISPGIFYELFADGKAKLLCEFGMTSSGTAMRHGVNYYPLESGAIKQIIEWADGTKTYLSPWNDYTKEKLSEIFKDCPKLKFKILRKEFKLRDMSEIIKFYNNYCDRMPLKDQNTSEE